VLFFFKRKTAVAHIEQRDGAITKRWVMRVPIPAPIIWSRSLMRLQADQFVRASIPSSSSGWLAIHSRRDWAGCCSC
jgi:hypothetical protein